MSEELINKEELLKKAKCNAYNCYYGTEEDCPHCEHMVVRYSDIDNSPTVEERKHGHWVWDNDEEVWKCSNCESGDDFLISKYCKDCGAIMDEDSETRRS